MNFEVKLSCDYAIFSAQYCFMVHGDSYVNGDLLHHLHRRLDKEKGVLVPVGVWVLTHSFSHRHLVLNDR